MAPLSVLVVDDDADMRIILRLVLDDAGYRVHDAADGERALALLRAAPQPWVVVLDLALRPDDARTLTDPRLRAITTGTPLASSSSGMLLRRAQTDPVLARHCFVAMTALPQAQFAPGLRDLLAATCLAVVAKPFDLDALLAAVQRAEQRLVASVRAAGPN
jgi:CheY-like chemotaxis protein